VKRLVVGLAGGIGSGKSSVAAFFRKWGARVVDADRIGHRVLDQPSIRARLVRAWGRDILDGPRVDRAALARIAFRSSRAISRLNRIVHPGIRREIRRQITRARGWVVLDAALLFEFGEDRRCDRVIYVRAPRAVRLRRLAARGWPPGELARRERLQWPAARKEKRADYVIDNAGSRVRAEKQARAIYDEIRRSF
jgi:dephospho-CoA kinase